MANVYCIFRATPTEEAVATEVAMVDDRIRLIAMVVVVVGEADSVAMEEEAAAAVVEVAEIATNNQIDLATPHPVVMMINHSQMPNEGVLKAKLIGQKRLRTHRE